MNRAIAQRYVALKFPLVRGAVREMMILAFMAGIDTGMLQAKDVIDTELKQLTIEWQLKGWKKVA